MNQQSSPTDLIEFYRYLEKLPSIQTATEGFSLFMNGNLTVSPESCIYINLEDSNGSMQANIDEVLWRLRGSDDITTLPKNSFIRQYAINSESKKKLLEKVNKDFLDKNSEAYKKYNEPLGLDKLDGKIEPLYNYTRAAVRTRPVNVFHVNTPVASDVEDRILHLLGQDEAYQKGDDEYKKTAILDAIRVQNSLVLDQLHHIFVLMSSRIMTDNPAQYVLFCTNPTLRALSVDHDNMYAANIFANVSPFPQGLDTIQFILMDDAVHLKMNFNVFDVGNLFDVFYGIVLLLLAANASQLPVGRIYISAPLFKVQKKYLSFFKTLRTDDLKRYKVSFQPDSTYVDEVSVKPHNFRIE